MRLLALGDVHVEHQANREALMALPAHPNDWLILAGDVSDTVAGLAWTLDLLGPKFAKLLWVPGNHDLWSVPAGQAPRGEARYAEAVATCRVRGVLTPEDPFATLPRLYFGRPVRVALLFVLYDYTFAPDEHTGRERAIAWAAESGILAADERLLHPEPYPSREAWCEARVSISEQRLAEAARDAALVLVNHWPLRRDVVRLGKVPRYSPWCGTRATEDWHLRYGAVACVHGHLHVRATDVRDGVRFEECSLGYPLHWDQARGAAHYLREVF